MESDGWRMYNGNRWVEPDEWKDGNYHGQYECYAKIDSGKKFVFTDQKIISIILPRNQKVLFA